MRRFRELVWDCFCFAAVFTAGYFVVVTACKVLWPEKPRPNHTTVYRPAPDRVEESEGPY